MSLSLGHTHLTLLVPAAGCCTSFGVPVLRLRWNLNG